MNRTELIKVFIISLKAKGKMYSKKDPEFSSPTTFKDKAIQRLWEGYQLCYDHFFQEKPVVVNKHIQTSPPPMIVPSTELALNQPTQPVKSGEKIRLINEGELFAVLINSTVSIVYTNKKKTTDQWVFKTAFLKLMDAVSLLNDIYAKRRINLEKWEPYQKPAEQMFLVPNSDKRRTHIWGGSDTLCRSWQNKSMRQKSYRLSNKVPLGKTLICANCISKIKPDNTQANLRFDTENRILEITPK